MFSILIKSFQNLRILSTYSIVGIGTSIGYFFLYVLLVEYFYLSPFLSAIFGYIPGIFISYILCYFWVFKSSKNIISTSFKFFSVNILGYFINFTGIFVLVNMNEFEYRASQFFLFFFVSLHNYLLNYYWTFTVQKTS